jgi:hypothetical protein
MRRNLRAYRNNPIEPDDALELVKYAVETEGDLRLEFTKADGTDVTAFVTPETTSLVAVNVRDADGNPLTKGPADKRVKMKPADKLTLDMRRVRGITPEGSDLKVKYLREDSTTTTLLVSPDKYVLVAYNFRDLAGHPLFPPPSKSQSIQLVKNERRSVDLKRIKSMGYVEPFDRQDAISSASGPYRFLHPDFPAEIEYKSEKYGSLSRAVDAVAPPSLFEGQVTAKTARLIDSLIRAKFESPTLARMLLSSGNRPIELDPSYGGIVGSSQMFPISQSLTDIRNELHSRASGPDALKLSKLPTLRIPPSEIPEEAATSAAAQGFSRMVLAELETDLARIQSVKEPELASDMAPLIDFVPIESISLEEQLPFDALIYIRANARDTILNQLATFPGKLAYMVVDLPADYQNVAEARKVAAWVASHPRHTFAVSLPPAFTQRNKAERLKTAAFAANLVAAVRSRDVFDPAKRKAVTNLFSTTGSLIIPFDGTVVDMNKTATNINIVIETEASDIAHRTSVEIPGDFKSTHEAQWLRGLAQKVPPITPLGTYVKTGMPPKLKVHEVLVLPKDRAPVVFKEGRLVPANLIGLEVYEGDEVALAGSRSDVGRHRAENLNIDAVIRISQALPITTAPVDVVLTRLPQTMNNRQTVASVLNDVFAADARGKRLDYLQIAGMSKGEKQAYVESIEAAPNIVPNPVRMGNAATLGLAQELMDKHGYTQEQADYAAEQVIPLPAATPTPVFYVLLVDTKGRRVYTPSESGAIPNQDLKERERVLEAAESAGVGEDVVRNAQYDRFMSDIPLNPNRLERMLRPLKRDQAEAVFTVLIPAVEKGKADKLFRWQPIPKGFGKGTTEAVQEVRAAIGPLAAAAAVRGQVPGGKASTAMVRLHKSRSPGGQGLSPSLREAAKTGTVEVGGIAASVEVPGEGSRSFASQVYLAGRGTRLMEYLDHLVSKMPITSKPESELQRTKGSLTRGYGTQAPEELRGTKRAQWTREEKESPDYVSPIEGLKAAAKAAQAVLDSPTSSTIRRIAAQATIDKYKEAEATQNEITRRKKEAESQKMKKAMAGRGVGTVGQFAFEFGRLPLEHEEAAMQKALEEGRDPIAAAREAMAEAQRKQEQAALAPAKPMSGKFADRFLKKNRSARRNPEGSDDDDPFAMFEGASAVAPEPEVVAPPPVAPSPPPVKPPEVKTPKAKVTPAAAAAMVPRQPTELVLPTRKPAYAPRPAGGYVAPFVRAPNPEVEVIPELRELNEQRGIVEEAWSKFAEELRAPKRRNKADLRALLQDYNEKRAVLNQKLDARDTAVLKTSGKTALLDLLDREAAKAMSAVQAAYTRPPLDSNNRYTAQARKAIVEEVGKMVDAMGRPFAPPSEAELRVHGLTVADLNPTDTPGHPLSYSALMTAAKIAAKATLRSKDGQAPSTISCRLMRSEPGVRQRMERDFINRITDAETYKGQLGQEGFARGRAALIWISPDATHAIFYVNGVGMCEFHSNNFEELLSSVFHFAQDWFNDPRSPGRSREYSLWVGQSGRNEWNAILYQVWGRRIEESADSGYLLQQDTGTMTGETSDRRLRLLAKVTPHGIEGPREVVQPSQLTTQNAQKSLQLKNLISAMKLRWITDRTAETRFGANMVPVQVLALEADAYDRALSAYGAKPLGAQAILKGGAAALRGLYATAAMQKAREAMEGKTYGTTLFYPALYGAGGALRPSKEYQPNSNTGPEVMKQLTALAEKNVLPPGAVVRIFDYSLFTKETTVSVLESPQMVGSGGKASSGGIRAAEKVPTPFAYLREKLKGRPDVTIQIVLPDRENLYGYYARAVVDREGYPKVSVVPAGPGRMFESFGGSILPGSTLRLWNDPDMGGSAAVFGSMRGMQAMADVISSNLPLIKSVIVETTGETRKIDGQEIEELYADPQVLRAGVIESMTKRVEAAGGDVDLFKTALGIPEDVYDAAGVSPQDDVETVAVRVMNAVAEKYGVQPIDYFRPGGRRTMWRDTSALDNRGRTHLYSAVRYLRR